MPRINLIGASNSQTNRTNQFGSMPGLAPMIGKSPKVTGGNGYKYSSVAANGLKCTGGDDSVCSTPADETTAMQKGCGLGRNGDHGRACLKHLNMLTGVQFRNDAVRGKLLS